MGLEENSVKEKPIHPIVKILEKASSANVPSNDPKTFKKIFASICATYGLENPVDQMLANRAAAHMMMLMYLEEQVKHYGVFTESSEGKPVINRLMYLVKRVEGEFRNYILMIKRSTPKSKQEQNDPKNFADWLNVNE